MKLLFLTPQLPFPPRQGATLRNFHLIQGLAKTHTIDLVTLLAPQETLTADNPLYTLCRRIVGLPQPRRSTRRRAWETIASPLPDMARRLDSPAMHQQLREWLEDEPGTESGTKSGYDIIQIEGIEMAPYMTTAETVLARTGAHTALFFDNHNCEYLLQKRNALNDLRTPKRLIGGLYSTIQWWKLRRYERWACTTATATLAVSGPDAQALQALTGPAADIHVIANGIAIDSCAESDGRAEPDPAFEEQATASEKAMGKATDTRADAPTGMPANQQDTLQPLRLVFTGKMDYRPNIDAVLWFGEHVLPRIARIRPNVLFQIVGMNPDPRILPLADSPYIEITGAVDDVQPYIQEAAVFVIPLRVGGGTRFKVLEAMAAQKAIVSTSLGAEGIPVVSGEQLLLADTPELFAQAVLDLLTDQIEAHGELTHTLGVNAKRFVAAHYAWKNILPQLEEIYQNSVRSSTHESTRTHATPVARTGNYREKNR